MEQQNDLLDHFYIIDDRSTSAVCAASAFEGDAIDLLEAWLFGQNVTHIRLEIVVMRAPFHIEPGIPS